MSGRPLPDVTATGRALSPQRHYHALNIAGPIIDRISPSRLFLQNLKVTLTNIIEIRICQSSDFKRTAAFDDIKAWQYQRYFSRILAEWKQPVSPGSARQCICIFRRNRCHDRSCRSSSRLAPLAWRAHLICLATSRLRWRGWSHRRAGGTQHSPAA